MKIFDYQKLEYSFREDLGKVAKKSAVRNKNKYGYFSQKLVEKEAGFWNESLIDTLSTVEKGYEGFVLIQDTYTDLLKIPVNTKNNEVHIMSKIIFSLFCSASKKGLIKFSPEFTYNSVFHKPVSVYEGFPFLFCLNQQAIALVNVSTISRIKKANDFLSSYWDEAADVAKSHYKSWNKGCFDIAKYMTIYNIEKFKDISTTDLNTYRINLLKIGKGALGPKKLLEYIDSKESTSLSFDYSAGALSAPAAPVLGTKLKGSSYKSHVGLSAKRMAGEGINSNAIVYKPFERGNEFKLGEYTLIISDADAFAPTRYKDQKSAWITSQKDYIEARAKEKSTRKSKIGRLRYLNVYLFDYLPFFFSENKTHFSFPNTPEEFLNYVFVKPSYVLDQEINVDESLKIYPHSVVSFIIKLTRSNKSVSSIKDNLARDVLAEISNYFDYILAHLSERKGFKIKFNPIEREIPTLGFRYNKSVKAKFDLKYWLVFRSYIVDMSRVILLDTSILIYKKLSILKRPHAQEAKQLCEDIIASCSSLKNVNIESYKTDANIINLPIEIQLLYGDEKINFKTDKVDLSLFKQRKLSINENGIIINHKDFQTWVSIVIACYAGQRNSNIGWVDTDSFDATFDSSINYSDDDLVPFYVATDKINPSGLDSQIVFSVFKLLQFTKRIRKFNQNKKFKEPIYYQLNEDSSFGLIRPLLQTNESNTLVEYNLALPQLNFEKAMEDGGIKLKKHLYYGHANLPPKELDYYKRNGPIPEEFNYKILNDKYNTKDKKVPFTPLQIRSYNTMHSLRKELVSVISLLLPNKEAVGLITGQSPVAAEFYEDNSPDEVSEIHSVLSNEGNNLVGVRDVKLDRDSVEASIINKTFMEDFKGVSSFPPAGCTSGIDDINSALTSDLALNWTHICPSNNICPADVIKTVGNRSCHICYKAIINKHHLPAISAKIKNLFEVIRVLYAQLGDDALLTEEDKGQIEHEICELNLQACSWTVRRNFIDKHPEAFLGNKTKPVDNLNKIEITDISLAIAARLNEVKGVPALQTEKVKSMASKMAKEVLKNIRKIGKKAPENKDEDIVSYAINNLMMLADLKGETINSLLTKHEFKVSPLYLEVFDDETNN